MLAVYENKEAITRSFSEDAASGKRQCRGKKVTSRSDAMEGGSLSISRILFIGHGGIEMPGPFVGCSVFILVAVCFLYWFCSSTGPSTKVFVFIFCFIIFFFYEECAYTKWSLQKATLFIIKNALQCFLLSFGVGTLRGNKLLEIISVFFFFLGIWFVGMFNWWSVRLRFVGVRPYI